TLGIDGGCSEVLRALADTAVHRIPNPGRYAHDVPESGDGGEAIKMLTTKVASRPSRSPIR
ncbi:MAG: hypothetical protein M3R66_01055, partial [Actinomycetota bacterium]|nr:hypothetical protein [Actinomycetota bacterium]